MAPPVIIYSSLTTAQNKSPPYRFINIVFGLVDFRRDGKYRKEN